MSKDPLMHSIEMTIISLRSENRQLKEENEGNSRIIKNLKNRIADLEIKLKEKSSPSKNLKESSSEEPSVHKESAEWGARDFLTYFQQLHLQWCGASYHFSRAVYEASLSQLKKLRQGHSLSNADIRDMFDFHFSKTFTEKFTPSVAYICSTHGVNRFYGSTRRSKMQQSTSTSSSGYSRRKLESVERWDTASSEEGAVDALDKRLKSRKKR